MVFSMPIAVPVHSEVARADDAAPLSPAVCDPVLVSFHVLCAFALSPGALFPSALAQGALVQFVGALELSQACLFLLVPVWFANAAVSPDAHGCYINNKVKGLKI